MKLGQCICIFTQLETRLGGYLRLDLEFQSENHGHGIALTQEKTHPDYVIEDKLLSNQTCLLVKQS